MEDYKDKNTDEPGDADFAAPILKSAIQKVGLVLELAESGYIGLEDVRELANLVTIIEHTLGDVPTAIEEKPF